MQKDFSRSSYWHNHIPTDSTIGESLNKIGLTVETCIEMDKLAQENHSYCPLTVEFERYKKNWYISLTTSGRNAPMKLRSDFREDVTIMNRLVSEWREERPEHQYQRWHSSSSSSSSTSWWQLESLQLTAWADVTCNNVKHACRHETMWRVRVFCSHTPRRTLSSMCHALVCLKSLRLSTLHSSHPYLNLLLDHLHILWGWVRRYIPCALPRRLFGQQHPSQKLWAHNVTDDYHFSETTQISSNSPPTTARPRTCMTRRLVPGPSAERSLHHSPLRSEKNHGAADKLVTTEESSLSSQSLSVTPTHQEFDSKWDGNLLSMTKIPSNNIWKDYPNKEYECLRNSRPYYRFIRRKQDLMVTDWRQWWKEVSNKIYEWRIVETWNGNSETNAVVKNRDLNSVNKEVKQIVGSKIHRAVFNKKKLQFPLRYQQACKVDTAESVSEFYRATEWEKCIENQTTQRQKSQWQNVSIAMQGLPQKNLHHSNLWKVAPSRMLVLQDQEWLSVWGKVLLCTPPSWWTA